MSRRATASAISTKVTLLLLTVIEALPNAGSCRWLPTTAFARLATKDYLPRVMKQDPSSHDG
jgi:hypothetical protein